MYWLGHLGITAGAAFASQKLFLKADSTDISEVKKQGIAFPDFRIIFAGAIAPDIIDKPIGYLFFDTTRLFGHSFAFYFLIFLFVWTAFKKYRSTAFMFSAAAFIHLIEDQMWKQSEVLFWPFQGLNFSATEQPGVSERVSSFFNENYLLVPEIIGGIILMSLILRLTARKSWRQFFHAGRID